MDSHDTADNLVEALVRAARRGDRGLTFVGTREAIELPYAELYERARRVAGGLRELGLQPGQALILLLNTGPAFAELFFGAQLAGLTPCPVSFPLGFQVREALQRRLLPFARRVEAAALVVEPALEQVALQAMEGTVPVHTPGRVPRRDPGDLPARVASARPALLQFTSGSTTRPRACVLSHRAVTTNARQIGWGIEVQPGLDSVCAWLPLHHDMGLIGCLLFSLVHGLDCYLMTPGRFLRRPASWLQTISRYRATLSPAPAFAYTQCTRRIRDAHLDGVDLSCWRVAFVGAEPINARELRAFVDRFAPRGLRAEALLPCYGLAEASLAVTFSPPATRFATCRASRAALAEQRRYVAARGDEDAVELVDCGRAMRGLEVSVVDEGGAALPRGRVGEIVVRGPTLFDGYHGQPDETARCLRDGALHTGDLGFCGARGELYITGRLKDVVIIHGNNYSPSEFEWIVGAVPGIRADNVAAFGVPDARTGSEVLGILAETDSRNPAEVEAVEERVRREVMLGAGLKVSLLVLAPPGTVPKTSSGKVRRAAAQQLALQREAGQGGS
jgi:acyl-CoA synthetase (AMP-forming)/AMP-acid ligase II